MENNQQQKDKFFTKLKYIIINYPIIEILLGVYFLILPINIFWGITLLYGVFEIIICESHTYYLHNLLFSSLPRPEVTLACNDFLPISFLFLFLYLSIKLIQSITKLRRKFKTNDYNIKFNHPILRVVLFFQHIFSWICYFYLFHLILYSLEMLSYSVNNKIITIILICFGLLFIALLVLLIKKSIFTTSNFIKNDNINSIKDYFYWSANLILFLLYIATLFILPP